MMVSIERESLSPSPVRRLTLGRMRILGTFVVTVFFCFWVGVSIKAGTTSGPGSLKDRLNCCGGVHVALGFWMWFWPPLLLAGIGYQVSDHYGWNGRGTEPWEDSLRDMTEYVIGFTMAHMAKNCEPLHTIDIRTYPAKVLRFLFDIEGWRGRKKVAE